MVKIKKNQGFFQKELFFATFVQQQNDNFFLTRPEKKIDRRKSRRGISTNAKDAVKHGTDKE